MNKLANIEFYTTPEGEVMIKPADEGVRLLSYNYPSDRTLIESFLSIMTTHYTDAFNALSDYYSKASSNKFYYEYQIASRFIRCNFGSYDTKDHDIDQDGMFNFEQVQCPLRGECKLENVCCNPTRNTTLSMRELEILRLIVEGLTSEQIGEQLFISPFTVVAHRRNIHAKTNTKTATELVNYFHINKLK